MRGQSHILMISNAIQELHRLREHLSDEQLVDLGANVAAVTKSLTCDNKSGLDDVIREHFKNLLRPANILDLRGRPAECRGGMFSGVLSLQTRPIFPVNVFKTDHPDLYSEYVIQTPVEVFQYKTKG